MSSELAPLVPLPPRSLGKSQLSSHGKYPGKRMALGPLTEVQVLTMPLIGYENTGTYFNLFDINFFFCKISETTPVADCRRHSVALC